MRNACNDVLGHAHPRIPLLLPVGEVVRARSPCRMAVELRGSVGEPVIGVTVVTFVQEDVRLGGPQAMDHVRRVGSLPNIGSHSNLEGVARGTELRHGEVVHLREAVVVVTDLVKVLLAWDEAINDKVVEDRGLVDSTNSEYLSTVGSKLVHVGQTFGGLAVVVTSDHPSQLVGSSASNPDHTPDHVDIIGSRGELGVSFLHI